MLKELERLFDLISVIPVSGNYVDTMAEIRALIRSMYAKAKEDENGRQKD